MCTFEVGECEWRGKPNGLVDQQQHLLFGGAVRFLGHTLDSEVRPPGILFLAVDLLLQGLNPFFRECPVFRPCLSIVWLASQPLQLANRACLPGLGGKVHSAFWLTPGRHLRVRPGVTPVRRRRRG